MINKKSVPSIIEEVVVKSFGAFFLVIVLVAFMTFSTQRSLVMEYQAEWASIIMKELLAIGALLVIVFDRKVLSILATLTAISAVGGCVITFGIGPLVAIAIVGTALVLVAPILGFLIAFAGFMDC